MRRIAARRLPAVLALALAALPAAAATAAAEDVVADGRRVSLEYTLTLEDGTRADSNVGKEPLVYTQGRHEILPALEEALAGLKAGERRKVTLPPEKAYGVHDPKLVVKVPRYRIPEQARKVGAVLIASSPTGQRQPVRVQGFDGSDVVLDFNHPLVDHTLTFDVKVVAVEPGDE